MKTDEKAEGLPSQAPPKTSTTVVLAASSDLKFYAKMPGIFNDDSVYVEIGPEHVGSTEAEGKEVVTKIPSDARVFTSVIDVVIYMMTQVKEAARTKNDPAVNDAVDRFFLPEPGALETLEEFEKGKAKAHEVRDEQATK